MPLRAAEKQGPHLPAMPTHRVVPPNACRGVVHPAVALALSWMPSTCWKGLPGRDERPEELRRENVGSRNQDCAFLNMVRITKWLASKGVPKTARAAAERLSARLSVMAVLGTLGAALYQPQPEAPSSARSVPIEILRTKPAPIILHEPLAERSTN